MSKMSESQRQYFLTSKQSSLQRKESIGTQRVKEEGTDDFEDVSEIPQDYWDQYITDEYKRKKLRTKNLKMNY